MSAAAVTVALLLSFAPPPTLVAPPAPAKEGAGEAPPEAGTAEAEVDRTRRGVETPAAAATRRAQASQAQADVRATDSAEGPARAAPLELGEVLGSVAEHDPRLEAAERKREGARGKAMAARGAFDPKLAARGLIQPLSYYQHGLVDVKVTQATPLWGLGVWAGWRVGAGDFAVYDGKLLTASGGELRAGASLPLWQGGPTDEARTERRVADLEVARQDAERDAKSLELQLKATKAYWDWVAAGQRLEVAEQLLEIAETRDVGLRRQIELGAVEAIVGVDNRRTILSRRGKVVKETRSFQKATLKLSLFLRDGEGEPVLAGRERVPVLPASVWAGEVPDLEVPLSPTSDEIEQAIANRPDIQALIQVREQKVAELRWARNQIAPRVDVSAWVAKDLGEGVESLLPPEVAATIELELPIPMRKARGKARTARAELQRVEAQLRLAQNEVAMEIGDAHSALVAAHAQLELRAEQHDLARQLSEAELRRFELGDSDLLRVNLRELAVAEAAAQEVSAWAELHQARAALDVSLGRPVGPEASGD